MASTVSVLGWYAKPPKGSGQVIIDNTAQYTANDAYSIFKLGNFNSSAF